MTVYYINANTDVKLESGTPRGDARNFGQLLSKITLVPGDAIKIVVELTHQELYVVDDTLSPTSNIPVGVTISPYYIGVGGRSVPPWLLGMWFDDSMNSRCVVKVPDSHELLVFGRRSSKTIIDGVEFVRNNFIMNPTLRFNKTHDIKIKHCKFSVASGVAYNRDVVGFNYPTFIKFDGVDKGDIEETWFEIKSIDDGVKKIPCPEAGAIAINKSTNITMARNYFDASEAGGTTTPVSINESGRVRVTKNMFLTSNPADYLPSKTKYFGAVMLTFCTTVVIDNNILRIDDSCAGVLFLSKNTNYTSFVIRNNVFRYFGESSDGMVAIHVDCDDPGLGFVSILNNIISSVSGYGYVYDVFLDKATSKVDYNMIDGISTDLAFVSRGSNPYTYADAPHDRYENPNLLWDVSVCEFSGKDMYFRYMVCVDEGLGRSPAIGTGSETTYIGIQNSYENISAIDPGQYDWSVNDQDELYVNRAGMSTQAKNLTDSVVVGMTDGDGSLFAEHALLKNCTFDAGAIHPSYYVRIKRLVERHLFRLLPLTIFI